MNMKKKTKGFLGIFLAVMMFVFSVMPTYHIAMAQEVVITDGENTEELLETSYALENETTQETAVVAEIGDFEAANQQLHDDSQKEQAENTEITPDKASEVQYYSAFYKPVNMSLVDSNGNNHTGVLAIKRYPAGSSSPDLAMLTYCINYHTSAATGLMYQRQDSYSQLTTIQQEKISYAMGLSNYVLENGAHNVDGAFSEWNAQTFMEYYGTQLYIWTVTDGITLEQAQATANLFDSRAGTSNTCYNKLMTLTEQIEEYCKEPSINGGSFELQFDAETALYTAEITDTNNMLAAYEINSSFESGITITRNGNTYYITSDHPISVNEPVTLTGSKSIDSAVLSYYTHDTSQNMVCGTQIIPNIHSFSFQIYTEQISVNISIHKEDKENKLGSRGDATLAGAVYGLYANEDIYRGETLLYEKDAFICLFPETNETGDTMLTDLITGSYYVKEEKAPKGYYLDETKYIVNAYPENNTSQINKEITIKEAPILQPIEITKIKSTGEHVIAPVEGAGFSLYLISDLLKIKHIPTAKDGSYDFSNFDFSDCEEAKVIVTADGDTELFTDAQGYGKTIDLYEGDYVLVETTVPAGYMAITPEQISLPQYNGDTLKESYHYFGYDKQIEAKLKLIKIDADTGEYIVHDDTTFKIYDINNHHYVTLYQQTQEGITALTEFHTDENGYLLLYDALKEGSYRLEESSPPKGYAAAQDIYFNVTSEGIKIRKEETLQTWELCETWKDIKGNIFFVITIQDKPITLSVSKQDITNQTELPGAKLTIYDEHNNIIDTWISQETPHIIKGISAGTYRLVEEAAPDGYGIAEEITFTVEATGELQTVTMYDVPFTNFTIQKFGDIPCDYILEETEYGTVYHLVYEKQPLENAVFYVYDQAGEKVDEMTTDKDGYAASCLLPAGIYTVQEIDTKAGLALSDTVYTVTLESGVQQSQPIVFNNNVMETKLSIFKEGEVITPSETTEFTLKNQPLEGVVFGIYTSVPILNTENQVLLEADTCVGVVKTNALGEGSITEAFIPGDYYYKELYTLEGYVLDEAIYPFTLSLDSHKETEEIALNQDIPCINYYIKGKLQLNKYDADTNMPLAGAQFGLYREEDDALIGVYTTNDQGQIIIEEMPYGSWSVAELQSPEGYMLEINKHSFQITQNNEEITINVYNQPELKLGSADYITPMLKTAIILCVLAICLTCIYIFLNKKISMNKR